MTRHAAHDAPFPFLLWHSRCQDASVMAAHTRLRTVCCRRAAVSRDASLRCAAAIYNARYCVLDGGDALRLRFDIFFIAFIFLKCFFSPRGYESPTETALVEARAEPLAAKGINLLHIVIRHTNTLRGLFLALSYIRSANFTDAIRFRRLDCLLLFLFFQVFTIALAPSPPL